jgi:DNA (cytosine-5)-methyltransferase 1
MPDALSVGSLFAGVGGFDLGLERAGMRSVWQCEIDPYCQRVLEKHWPDVLRVRDVRDVGAGSVPRVDVLCGGFPCQPVSDAGLKQAQEDSRWLWPEFARVVGELRPRYVIVENVPGLRSRGFGDVLRDLAACGFDAEWDGIPAAALGAHHQRDRVVLVAYADEERRDGRPRVFGEGRRPESPHGYPLLQDADRLALGARWEWRRVTQAGGPEWWPVEPDVDRVAYGIPDRLDRLAALGNAIVPQLAEWIGRRIVAYEGEADAI